MSGKAAAGTADMGLGGGASPGPYLDEGERAYVDGAPHVKHGSVRELHASLVVRALGSLDRAPSQVSVLDLGAGSGLTTRLWYERGAQVTAVDRSAEQLELLAERAAAAGAAVRCVSADARAWVSDCAERFDVVTAASALHHVPDYLGLLRDAVGLLAPGGVLLTVQDPLRYDTLARGHRAFAEGTYLAWRLPRGSYRRGLRSRWRRLHGTLSDADPSDMEEYHVVRGGVDAEAIRALLGPGFREMEIIDYWSTQSRLFQWAGERLRLRSTFAVLALGRGAGPVR